uniref:response regulator n=1 Tax=Methanoregula sp. TaxID=2052170 RepID=UPI003C28893C
MFLVPISSNHISVLYVDDEPALLDLGKKFLERGGVFDVETTDSSSEVLALLQKKDYDSLISDYQMPEMDGIVLLKKVRSRYPDLPFILFTGKGREEIVIQAFDAGADYYVQKGGDIHSQFRELGHKIRLAVEKRHADRALKESEERYRNVVKDQNEFICRFRPDGIQIFVNDAYCRYFGLQEENIIGHRFIPQIPEEDAMTVRSHFASLTRNRPLGTVEHRIILPDGSVRWHQWSDRAIFDESGTLVEYQSVGRDITDRKTAELDLVKKNDELRAAFEQLTAVEEELRTSYTDLAMSQRTLEDREITLNAILQESPIPQFVIDRNHKILYWNHALAAYSGIAADDVIGTDQQWRAFYSSKRPCLVDLLVDNAQDKLPEWYLDKYEKSVLINDAYEATDFFPQMGREGKWLHFTAGLINNRNGDAIGAVETLEDITERKLREDELAREHSELNASYEQLAATEEELRNNYDELVKLEKELRESREQYRTVVEDQTELICRSRPDGTHVFVNDAYCRYFNKTREEIVGHHFQPELFFDDRKQVREMFASLTPENPVGSIRQRVIFPDGSIRWLSWVNRAIYDGSRALVEYQSVGRDITNVKIAELNLMKKNELLHAAYEQLTATEEELRTNFEDLAKSQQALRESEERYRTVVEDQTELICRFRPDGTHVFVNDAYCRYFNKTREEIIGHIFTPEIPEEDRKLIVHHFKWLTPEYPVATIDYRIIMPGGSICWQSWVNRAIYDESGALVEYQSVGRDITEYKRMEKALRLSEERYRNMVEQFSDQE